LIANIALFVNKMRKNHIIIKDNNVMADKQVVSKGFRVSVKADEILKEVSKRDFRDFPTVVRFSLLGYVKEQHPDLYDALATEFTPQ